MKTKLIALTTLITILAFTVQAQQKSTRKKITFGVRAGVNFQNVTWDHIDGEGIDTKLKTGFHAGVNAEIPVGADFYVQPGILFSNKGAKIKQTDAKINTYYVEVPINFVYKPELGKGNLLLGVGPYIGIGLAGNVKNGHDIDIEWANEISKDQYNSDFGLKRLDAGGNLLAGYEFSNKLSFQLNAQLGLLDIHPKVNGVPKDDAKFKNVGFGISAGYRF